MKLNFAIILAFLFFISQPIKSQETTFQKKSRWITPIALSGLGLTLYNESSKNAQLNFRNNHIGNFQTRADDFLQYTPSLLFVGANLVEKMAGKNTKVVKDNLVIFVIGTGTYVAISQILKRAINETRPDGGDYSFPSGHTSTAFFGARILDKEFRKTHPWLVVGGYSIATATGVLRMANNKHWASDVLVGAGLGMASAEFAHWIYPKLKTKLEKQQAFLFEPILAPNLYAVRLEYRF